MRNDWGNMKAAAEEVINSGLYNLKTPYEDIFREKGENCSFDAIKEDIEKRDYEDMHRAISPLKQADDAVLVDTSDMNIEQVVAALSKIIDEKKAGR